MDGDGEEQLELPFVPYARPALIGIVAGRMGSGKSEVANRLIRTHGYSRVSLAWPIKDTIIDLLVKTGFTLDEAEDMVLGSKKETPIALLGDKSSRQLMQSLGTDWGRNMVDERIWERMAEEVVKDYLSVGEPVVIDDIRFHNEAAMILRNGGFLIYVDRLPDEDWYLLPDSAKHHESEGQLTWLDCNYVIENDGTLKELIQKTDEALDHLSARLT
jgi:hypothetical protein